MSAAAARRRAKTRMPKASKRLLTGFTPPEGVPLNFEASGLGGRFAAQIADILITVAALIIFFLVLGYSNILPPSGWFALFMIAFFAIRVPYYTLAEILWNGQTLGKKLTGLRVISGDGRSLSPHAVTIRNLMKEMEVFTPGTLLLVADGLSTFWTVVLLIWICILLTVPLTNRHRQRLGDILANTYVIHVPKPVLLPELASGETAQRGEEFRFLPHHLDHYGRFELQTLESLLQVRSVNLNRTSLTRHNENLARVADTIVTRIGYDVKIPPEKAESFLLSFYRTQRAYLENRKLFGDAREDKFHGETGNEDGK